jgi:VWFA-related protein
VLDDRKPRKISGFWELGGKTFSSETHVVVVLDGINDDGGSSLGHARKDLEKYLSQSRDPLLLPLSLFFVSSAGTSQTQPTTDRASIVSQLAQHVRHPRDPDCGLRSGRSPDIHSPGMGADSDPNLQDQSCLFDRFRESWEALRKLMVAQESTREHTIVIWTGDGWPISRIQGAEGVLVELNTDLRDAQVTFDALSWSAFKTYLPSTYLPYLPGGASVTVASPRESDVISLQDLARQNGGLVFSKVKDFGDAISACMADAADFYELGFDSTPSASADEYHAIDVSVDRPGVSVRTATGYYAQP